MSNSEHIVQFFRSDDEYVRAAGYFLREGLEAGGTCVAVATAEHHRQLDASFARCRTGSGDALGRVPLRTAAVPSSCCATILRCTLRYRSAALSSAIQSADQPGQLARGQPGTNFRRNGLATGRARPARRGHPAGRTVERAQPAASLQPCSARTKCRRSPKTRVIASFCTACTVTWCAKAPEAAARSAPSLDFSAPRFAATMAFAFAPISVRAPRIRRTDPESPPPVARPNSLLARRLSRSSVVRCRAH